MIIRFAASASRATRSQRLAEVDCATMARSIGRLLDMWFTPKQFESERLYERLGARALKRYVPTGGDVVMKRLRRGHPDRRWVALSADSLRQFERRTRVNETIHLVGSIGGAVLTVARVRRGALTHRAAAAAFAANALVGL